MEAMRLCFQLCKWDVLNHFPCPSHLDDFIAWHLSPLYPFPSFILLGFTSTKICQFICLGFSLTQTMASAQMWTPMSPCSYVVQRRVWQSEKSDNVFVKAFRGNCESFICLKQLKQEWKKACIWVDRKRKWKEILRAQGFEITMPLILSHETLFLFCRQISKIHFALVFMAFFWIVAKK